MQDMVSKDLFTVASMAMSTIFSVKKMQELIL